MKIIRFIGAAAHSVVSRYRSLEETWQRGYSPEYRLFRFREAFYPLLGDPGQE